ncbi:MAG: cyclic nucleotide-binding domain-containing protein, partial [Anaerolineae bacterium]|nr:cyclic nucleotide-binding domain-containing protein [Anaerolineae bacterium]
MDAARDHLGDFLVELHIFQGLSIDEVTEVSALFKHYRLGAGERLYDQGDFAENFYILASGHMRVWQREDGEDVQLAVLEAGDTFGEEELLNDTARIANIEAVDDVGLYYLDNFDFEWLLDTHPSIYQSLIAQAESNERARRKHLNWLAETETVHLISQRHIAHLLFNLLKPTALLLPGGLVLSYIYIAPTLGTQMLASVFSGLLILAGLLLAAWYLIDWRNDYFVITNQRVVWLEEVIMQSA